MGKKKSSAHKLGTILLKDRFGHTKKTGDSFLHTSELNDGFEWQKNNGCSVTEESSLEAFLNAAQMAGTDFTAERLNAQIIADATTSNRGVLTTQEEETVRAVQAEHRELLRIPRRPAWEESTTAEELDRLERDAFLEWRRDLALLQEKEHILMTPFERNLEFWRQLWRVIERSDVVVQIVDARNPLLFRSVDLDSYVKEVGEDKEVMVLINKADYLSEKQRTFWADYFDSIGVKVAFWSAVEEAERITKLEEEAREAEARLNEEENEDESEDEEEDESEEEYSEDEEEDQLQGNPFSFLNTDPIPEDNTVDDASENLDNMHLQGQEVPSSSTSCDNKLGLHDDLVRSVLLDKNNKVLDNRDISDMKSAELPESTNELECDDTNTDKDNTVTEVYVSANGNSTRSLTGDELVDLLKQVHSGPRVTEDITTIGLVGYPNVGKSSSINSLLRSKKVPVSATPGRTKHFQTLYVGDELLLCDCPGLVMPSFVCTKAEMVLNGILPIDQMRDYIPPIAHLVGLIPREVLEATYGIMLPMPREDEDPHRDPTAHELLSTYGLMRGYMSHKGIPDYHRASRDILKDYVKGKLLFCHPPPDVSREDFESAAPPTRVLKLKEEPTLQKLPKGAKRLRKFNSEVDRDFFQQSECRIGSKGIMGAVGAVRQGAAMGVGFGGAGDVSGTSSLHSSMTSVAGKPWKKHGNRGKKEKLRRLHSQLDVV